MKQDIINKIQHIIANKEADEKEMLFQLKGVLYEIELQNQIARESKNIADLVSENLTQLKEETHQGNAIKTGFTEFDKLFGGFGLGELIVIGGRPSMGKTQLLVNLSLNISVATPVLYFTFDLSEFLLTSRFISSFQVLQ
jgi:replicative DNA helicase